MKRNIVISYLLFIFGMLLFADVTNDVQSDVLPLNVTVEVDNKEDDAAKMIDEVLTFGIDSEVVALLSEIGSNPEDKILQKVLARYKGSNLVTTKIDFVKYFAKVEDAPIFLVDALYQDASDDFVDKQLQISLINCFAKIGKSREGRYILNLVDSDDRMLSYTATQSISSMNVPELVPDILARLKLSDEDEEQSLSTDAKSRLILALGQSNEPDVIEYLRNVAQDVFADKFQVAYAMDGLAKQKDLESIQLMEQNLGHNEVKVQEYAAHALSLFESEQVIPILNKMMLHNNETVRVYACQGLALNKNKSAVQSLSYKYRRDPSAKVKNAALEALLQLDGEGVAELKNIFNGQKMSSSYLSAITDGIAKYPTTQNIDYLFDIYNEAVSNNDKKLIDAIANRIVFCKSNLVDKIISLMLDSQEYLIRMGGIKAVNNIKDTTLLPKLQEIANTDDVKSVSDYARKILALKEK